MDDLYSILTVLVGSMVIGFMAELARAVMWCYVAYLFYKRARKGRK